MKRTYTTTRYLLLILAVVLLNNLLHGTANLVVTILLCIALIPVTRRMDREAEQEQ